MYICFVKESIQKLRDEGKNYNEIGKILGLAKSTISYYVGSRKGKHDIKYCRNCNASINQSQTFCSDICQKENKNKTRIERLENGELSSNKTIRKALLEIDARCSLCGTTPEWNGKPLTLDVDHIDGNSDNNEYKNLRLLCPNCHSQMETSKGTPFVKKETKRNRYLRKYKNYGGLAQLEEL